MCWKLSRRPPGIGLTLIFALAAALSRGASPDQERTQMLDEIRQSVRESASYTGRETLHPATLAAMGAVPREEFVPPALRHLAYQNRPLPIGEGQTISQPLIVALMTDLLEPAADHVILEVGTGSGYQAAVLSQLVRHVYTIEIIPELAARAGDVLEKLQYANVSVRTGDGYAGWPEHAPYDGIIVTAAPDEIPPPLLEQLKPGGRLVLPLGPVHGFQQLVLIEKNAAGQLKERTVLPVTFVPLKGKH